MPLCLGSREAAANKPLAHSKNVTSFRSRKLCKSWRNNIRLTRAWKTGSGHVRRVKRLVA